MTTDSQSSPKRPSAPTYDAYLAAFADIFKRRHWRRDEFALLLRGYEPIPKAVVQLYEWNEFSKVYALIADCTGGPGSESDLIIARDCIDWVCEGRLTAHSNFMRALSEVDNRQGLLTTPASKTDKANRARENQQRRRKESVKDFLKEFECYSKGSNLRYHVNREIWATKDDTKRAFDKLYPKLKRVTADTLVGDIHELGWKLKRGVKPNKNNALARMISVRKKG